VYPGATRRGARQQAGFGLRILGATLAMLFATFAARELVNALADPAPGLSQAVVLLPAILAGASTYVGLSLVMGLPEPRRIAELARQHLSSAR
jgi:hypothetical protein